MSTTSRGSGEGRRPPFRLVLLLPDAEPPRTWVTDADELCVVSTEELAQVERELALLVETIRRDPVLATARAKLLQRWASAVFCGAVSRDVVLPPPAFGDEHTRGRRRRTR